MSTSRPPYTIGTLTSADGYRKLGEGPGVVLLSAGFLAAQHYMGLAGALSDAFTVSVILRGDERGGFAPARSEEPGSLARDPGCTPGHVAARQARGVKGVGHEAPHDRGSPERVGEELRAFIADVLLDG